MSQQALPCKPPLPKILSKMGFFFFATVSSGRKNSVLKGHPEYFGVIPFLNQDVSFINLYLGLTN